MNILYIWIWCTCFVFVWKKSSIQNKLLEKLKVLNTIFDENEIDWSVAAGAIIEALRHKGFVRWDNDFDLMIKE